MQERRIVDPAEEPLELSETREQLRIDGHAEDRRLEGLIRAARQQLEAERGVALITQTWEISLPGFPCGAIVLPKPPLQSVTHVKYYDAAGTLQTWASSEYAVLTQAGPKARRARILPVFQATYPTTQDVPEAVVVRFVAGFGNTALHVPETLRQALLLHVGEMFRDREQSIVGTIVTQRPAYDRLVSSGVEITA